MPGRCRSLPWTTETSRQRNEQQEPSEMLEQSKEDVASSINNPRVQWQQMLVCLENSVRRHVLIEWNLFGFLDAEAPTHTFLRKDEECKKEHEKMEENRLKRQQIWLMYKPDLFKFHKGDEVRLLWISMREFGYTIFYVAIRNFLLWTRNNSVEKYFSEFVTQEEWDQQKTLTEERKIVLTLLHQMKWDKYVTEQIQTGYVQNTCRLIPKTLITWNTLLEERKAWRANLWKINFLDIYRISQGDEVKMVKLYKQKYIRSPPSETLLEELLYGPTNVPTRRFNPQERPASLTSDERVQRDGAESISRSETLLEELLYGPTNVPTRRFDPCKYPTIMTRDEGVQRYGAESEHGQATQHVKDVEFDWYHDFEERKLLDCIGKGKFCLLELMNEGTTPEFENACFEALTNGQMKGS